VNCFEDAPRYRPQDVRTAVDLDEPVPIVMCDARQRGSSRDVLIALVEHSLRTMPPADEQPADEQPTGEQPADEQPAGEPPPGGPPPSNGQPQQNGRPGH
jgi:hypothetical protein